MKISITISKSCSSYKKNIPKILLTSDFSYRYPQLRHNCSRILIFYNHTGISRTKKAISRLVRIRRNSAKAFAFNKNRHLRRYSSSGMYYTIPFNDYNVHMRFYKCINYPSDVKASRYSSTEQRH
ncbi:unnamed protein product [Acanthoscelides obtectus]|uniref:Uncharacterized protein n=1 Tax=Acanthoscelides obtectus TaxID=200917 RepID=A0A9P0MF28_ACAOB|nr:unnamed protein product [Acanthoscelides obtectus]CAK1679769.1 hypothetical protein AOBTE_LOCUS32429 [Acanthoscelides obtectus]